MEAALDDDIKTAALENGTSRLITYGQVRGEIQSDLKSVRFQNRRSKDRQSTESD